MKHPGSRSPAETAFASALAVEGLDKLACDLGFRIYTQYNQHRAFLDFAFVHHDGRRLDVEIDGPEHRTARGILGDKLRDQFLCKYGWRVLRIEAQIEVQDYTSSVCKVREVLDSLVVPTSEQLKQMVLSFEKRIRSGGYHPNVIAELVRRFWRDTRLDASLLVDQTIHALHFAHAISLARDVYLDHQRDRFDYNCNCAWCKETLFKPLIKRLKVEGQGVLVVLFSEMPPGEGWHVAVTNGHLGYALDVRHFTNRQDAVSAIEQIDGVGGLRTFCFCERDQLCGIHDTAIPHGR